jgi:hypothetical protein
MAEKLGDIEFNFEFTCPKCGCHNYEKEGSGWLEQRKICTNCRVVF